MNAIVVSVECKSKQELEEILSRLQGFTALSKKKCKDPGDGKQLWGVSGSATGPIKLDEQVIGFHSDHRQPAAPADCYYVYLEKEELFALVRKSYWHACNEQNAIDRGDDANMQRIAPKGFFNCNEDCYFDYYNQDTASSDPFEARAKLKAAGFTEAPPPRA